MLHAAVLRFAHPGTGAPLAFHSAMPDDMTQFAAERRS
jgi:23S rRNA-/tRNA-specific pseudouridylate synthase